MMRSPLRVSLFSLIPWMLVACVDQAGVSAPGAAPVPAALPTGEWRLLLQDGEAVPDGVRVTAHFEDGRVSGSAGCNNYFAEYARSDSGGLRVGPPASTRKLCRGPADAVERAYLQALPGVHRYLLEGEQLHLRYRQADTGGELVFGR